MEYLALYCLLAYNAAGWLHATGRLFHLLGSSPAAAGPYEHGLSRGLLYGAPLSLPAFLLAVLLSLPFQPRP